MEKDPQKSFDTEQADTLFRHLEAPVFAALDAWLKSRPEPKKKKEKEKEKKKKAAAKKK